MEPIEIGNALKIGRATHAGMSGKHNEDYYGLFAWRMQDGRPFYVGVVADGVGGQNAGEVASQLAVKRIGEYFTGLPQVNNVLAHLERAILSAHEAVYQYSQEHPETKGMATTMVIAAILDDRLYTSTVGDSRVYFWREGRLRQISVDHTWAQEAIEAGLLTPEQAKTHPNRNVIKRFLGSASELQVDQRLMWEEGQSERVARGNQGLVLEPGDTVLLNSDGLTDMIEDSAVLQSLHRHYYNLSEAADELIEKANEGGGKDNITALILQVPGGRLGAGAAPPATVITPAMPPPPTVVRAPMAVPMAAPLAPPVAVEPPRRSGLALALIIGGVGLLALLLVLGVGGLLLAAGNNDEEPPSATPTVAVVEPAATASHTSQPTATPSSTAESPATAILIVPTVDEAGQTAVATAGSSATSPALIPTLQPTWTATPRPPTPTRTPTATSMPTATPTPQGGGDPPPPPPPPATDPPTDVPPPTPE
jgi:serine/threonine protein phosphatase PrpC